jgi:beta-xylosidase
MRRLLVFALLSACATDDVDPDEPAVLEDASAETEPTVDEIVDDSDDLAEADEPAEIELMSSQYKNSVGPSCADPGVIKLPGADGPTFWAACTGGNFALFKSRDLVHWSAAGHIFTAATKPKWGTTKFWAPVIHRVADDKLIAYFSAFSPGRGKMCIGAARASTMAGPWHDLGHPLVCDAHNGLIDAHVFYDASTERRYLYYKTDGNSHTPKDPTIIYGHQLTANGLGFVGKRRALIHNTLGWEGDVVEAPWLLHRGNFYYLFYSGFRYCDATYGVGIARARSPLGPFTKKSGPILRSNATWSGPGHNAVVRTGGSARIVYHAWSGKHTCQDDGSRKLMIDRIGWKGGWPVIGNGTPSTGPKAAPVVP